MPKDGIGGPAASARRRAEARRVMQAIQLHDGKFLKISLEQKNPNGHQLDGNDCRGDR